MNLRTLWILGLFVSPAVFADGIGLPAKLLKDPDQRRSYCARATEIALLQAEPMLWASTLLEGDDAGRHGFYDFKSGGKADFYQLPDGVAVDKSGKTFYEMAPVEMKTTDHAEFGKETVVTGGYVSFVGGFPIYSSARPKTPDYRVVKLTPRGDKLKPDSAAMLAKSNQVRAEYLAKKYGSFRKAMAAVLKNGQIVSAGDDLQAMGEVCIDDYLPGERKRAPASGGSAPARPTTTHPAN